MAKPNILFILHLPPPIHGPAIVGQYIQQSNQINNAFNCEYIGLQTSKHLNQIGGGGVGKLLVFIRLYLTVIAKLIRNRYDYCYLSINAHGPAFYKEIIIVFLLRIFGLKPIYYYHMKGVKRFQEKWLPDKLYRFQFMNSRTILLSPLIYWDVEKYVPKEKVFYCIEGIPDAAKRSTKVLRSNRLNKAVPELLFLSNMMKAKGVFVLLEACKILYKKGHRFKTIFIGGAIDIDEYEFNEFAGSNGLQDYLCYVGPKYGAEKVDFFERVDLFIHPTLNDVLPLTIIEAFQYGLPVISTNEGAIAEMVKDGITGYIVPKNDPEALAAKIEYLLINPELRLKMGQQARESYEKRFTLQEFEKNLVTAIQSAINDFELDS